MLIQIKNRWTDSVIFEGEYPSMRVCVEDAIKKRANMRGADMSGADMRDANMRGADMRGADMSGADMRGANMSDADMRGANMSDANMRGADMSDANMRGADMRGADMRGANMRGLRGLPFAPKIPNLNSAILAAIDKGGELEMGSWHICETTHCRAGWTIHLAGDAGKVLESILGSATAGGLIYHASTGVIPDFYASNGDALADIKACAAKEVE